MSLNPMMCAEIFTRQEPGHIVNKICQIHYKQIHFRVVQLEWIDVIT